MEQVRDHKIMNDSVCGQLYHVPTMRNQITVWKLTFLEGSSSAKALTSPQNSLTLGATTSRGVAEFSRPKKSDSKNL